MLGEVPPQTNKQEYGPPIPDEATVSAQYAAVSAEIGAVIPNGFSLGQLLAKLRPEQEQALRGHYGLYPFEYSHTCCELAAINGSTEQELETTLGTTIAVLRQPALQPKLEKDEGPITLERLAWQLEEHAEKLRSFGLILVRELYGLPPYYVPQSRQALAAKHGISLQVVSKRISAVYEIVFPERFAPLKQRSRKYRQQRTSSSAKIAAGGLTTNEQQLLFEDRDIGWYAEMLYRLSDEVTRYDWARILLTDLQEDAVLHRKVTQTKIARKADRPQRKIELSKTQQQSHATLDERRAFRPELDTPDGRLVLVRSLMGYADRLSPADRAMLPEIIERGKAAQQELLEYHSSLVWFASVDEKSGRLLFKDVGIAYEGLIRAIRGFDRQLGFQFSTFAMSSMKGHIRTRRIAHYAKKMQVSTNIFLRIRKMQAAEEALIAASGGKNPSEEELAKTTGFRVKTIKKYKKAMTAEQSEISTDAPLYSDSAVSMYDKFEKKDYALEDVIHANNIRTAFLKAFEAATLTDKERQVLLAQFGIEPYMNEMSRQEIADMLLIDSQSVSKLTRSARRKIVASPESAAIFYHFLSRKSTT